MVPFRLSILTPERVAYEGDVDYVNAPGLAGGFGVLARHMPMITVLSPGNVKVKRGDETLSFDLPDGVVEVKANHMTILTSRFAAASDG